MRIIAIFILTLFLSVVQGWGILLLAEEPPEYEVSSADGLSLHFNGSKISEVRLNASPLPTLKIKDLTGIFSVKDMSDDSSYSTPLYGNVYQNQDNSITQKAWKSDLSFVFNYIPHNNYIEITGDIQNLRNDDRALQLTFSLPINAKGWKWGYYIRSSININDNNTYKYNHKIGSTAAQNIYPFSSISTEDRGIAIAVPMDEPRIYRTSYSTSTGYAIQYDLALSSQTTKLLKAGHASFKFIIYKNDEPSWGFRGAVKKYYKIYPDYFKKRVTNEGLWMVQDNKVINIPHVEEFGFAFDPAGTDLQFNSLHDIYSFAYNEPWGWWRWYGESEEPSYATKKDDLTNDMGNEETFWKKIPGITIGDVARAVDKSAPYNTDGDMHLNTLPDYFWHYWNGYYQNFPTNPSPHIPGPNRYDISQQEYLYRDNAAGGFIDNWKFDSEECSRDNTASHSGSYSAKIGIPSGATAISGSWKSAYINVSADKEYTFSGYIKTQGSSSKPDTLALHLFELDANGENKCHYIIYPATINSEWTLCSKTFTTNPSTTKVLIYGRIYNGNGTVWFDDVSLIEKGSSDNLIQNPGFETNGDRGEQTKPHLDGIFLDSVTDYLWGQLENRRQEHWEFAEYPLVFNYSDKKPVILGIFSQYEYIKKVSDDFHSLAEPKLLMGNITPFAYIFYAHRLDVLGSEVPEAESDWKLSLRRTLSYQKPNSTLLTCRWRSSIIPSEEIESYMKTSMFYGIFPAISSAASTAVDSTDTIIPTQYWSCVDENGQLLYERDRNLFKKYIPIIKDIAKAGWEPIPYATISNPSIKLERYGYADTSLYYTLRNDTDVTQKGLITFDLPRLGITADILNALERTTNTNRYLTIYKSRAILSVSVKPKDTLVFQIKTHPTNE
ncbi:MAG: carbohydrate binding domain-containing protein [Candidatus Omnitrophota bacterium]